MKNAQSKNLQFNISCNNIIRTMPRHIPKPYTKYIFSFSRMLARSPAQPFSKAHNLHIRIAVGFARFSPAFSLFSSSSSLYLSMLMPLQNHSAHILYVNVFSLHSTTWVVHWKSFTRMMFGIIQFCVFFSYCVRTIFSLSLSGLVHSNGRRERERMESCYNLRVECAQAYESYIWTIHTLAHNL